MKILLYRSACSVAMSSKCCTVLSYTFIPRTLRTIPPHLTLHRQGNFGLSEPEQNNKTTLSIEIETARDPGEVSKLKYQLPVALLAYLLVIVRWV